MDDSSVSHHYLGRGAELNRHNEAEAELKAAVASADEFKDAIDCPPLSIRPQR